MEKGYIITEVRSRGEALPIAGATVTGSGDIECGGNIAMLELNITGSGGLHGETLTAKEAERERLIEILKYQIDDIDALGLKDGEEEELIDKKLKIKNSEKITKKSEEENKETVNEVKENIDDALIHADFVILSGKHTGQTE